jgi:hypothetical protein
MINPYTPTLWRQRRALERAADEILRTDQRKQQRSPATFARRPRSPREAPEEPSRYRLEDLPLLRRKGLIP